MRMLRLGEKHCPWRRRVSLVCWLPPWTLTVGAPEPPLPAHLPGRCLFWVRPDVLTPFTPTWCWALLPVSVVTPNTCPCTCRMCAPVMVELEGETDPLLIAMKELK